MGLHLIKLCVGADSIDDLREWVSKKSLAAIAAGLEPHMIHTTRMIPKRAEKMLDGGSLYWVIKRQAQARQKLIDIRSFTSSDGISRCDLILGSEVVETARQPRQAFQGWHYLKSEEATSDLASLSDGTAGISDELKRQLAKLSLL